MNPKILTTIHNTNEKKLVKSEQQEQETVISWLRYQYPDVLFCASAGGLVTSKSSAIKMRKAGYVRGFPDLFIYEPSGPHHGLAIELKRERNSVTSAEQKKWISDLQARGYSAYVCHGADEAMRVITEYFDRRTESIFG